MMKPSPGSGWSRAVAYVLFARLASSDRELAATLHDRGLTVTRTRGLRLDVRVAVRLDVETLLASVGRGQPAE